MEKHEIHKTFSEVGRRIRQARVALGYDTQADLAAALGGMTVNRVSRAERAENPVPSEMLYELATRLDLNINWLLTGEGLMMNSAVVRMREGVSPEELRAISEDVERLGRRVSGLTGFTVPMPSEMQARLDARIAEKRAAAAAPSPPAPAYRPVRIVEAGFEEVAAEALPEGRLDPSRYVPIISGIAAGAALETTEAEQQPAGLADSFLRFDGAPPGAFALRVVGSSMAPEYQGGDVVVVDPSRRVTEGVACVVYDAGDARVGRLKHLRIRGAKAYLESANPAYPPVEIPKRKIVAAWAVAAHLPCRLERSVP